MCNVHASHVQRYDTDVWDEKDFKTAHLLGVCPRSQFLAMLIGSAVSVPVSVAAYTLYTNAYQVPGPEFPAPTASIWLDMAQLVRSSPCQGLDHVAPDVSLGLSFTGCPLSQSSLLTLQPEWACLQEQWEIEPLPHITHWHSLHDIELDRVSCDLGGSSVHDSQAFVFFVGRC